jgi:hypothetical protein
MLSHGNTTWTACDRAGPKIESERATTAHLTAGIRVCLMVAFVSSGAQAIAG